MVVKQPNNATGAATHAATVRAGAKRTRTAHLKHDERETSLRDLLAKLRLTKIPSWPADFCERAKISKKTLARFPEVAAQVNAYGWATSPRKMRPHAPRARSPSAEPAQAAVGGGAGDAGSRALRARETKLRHDLAAAKRAVREGRAREKALYNEIATRGRLIEELISRLVTPRNGIAEQVADVLASVRCALSVAVPGHNPSHG